MTKALLNLFLLIPVVALYAQQDGELSTLSQGVFSSMVLYNTYRDLKSSSEKEFVIKPPETTESMQKRLKGIIENIDAIKDEQNKSALLKRVASNYSFPFSKLFIRILVERGADANVNYATNGYYQRTALRDAVFEDDKDMVALLLRHNAHAAQKSSNGYLIEEAKSLDVTRLLLENKAFDLEEQEHRAYQQQALYARLMKSADSLPYRTEFIALLQQYKPQEN